MQNEFEKGPERIPTKVEVMEVVNRFAENPTFISELSDEQGLCFFEVKVEEAGVIVEYRYMRRGKFPTHETKETTIYVTYYEDGKPVSGYNPPFPRQLAASVRM